MVCKWSLAWKWCSSHDLFSIQARCSKLCNSDAPRCKICKNHIIVTTNQSWCILHFDIIDIHWYSLIFYQALSQAWLQFLVYSPSCEETKRPRMSSGETAFHVTRWAKHAFQLSAKPSPQDSKDGADLCAKKTGDLRKIYMSFIWASYESCCMPQQYAKRVHVPSAPSESRWLWTWSELHSQNDLVIGQLVKKCRKMLEECRWLLSPTTWRHDRQSYSQSLECVCVCCTMLHHVYRSRVFVEDHTENSEPRFKINWTTGILAAR